MESRVLHLGDVHTIVNIMVKDPQIVQNKRKFYNSIGLPPGEFFDIERRANNSGSESYEFFSLALEKWIRQEGKQACVETLVNHLLQEEEFQFVAGEIIQCKFDAVNNGKNRMRLQQFVWFNVPEPIKNFTGRTQELAELHENITKSQESRTTVITTVSGLGGIGKTSLAVQYIHEYYDYYGNVVWINAENETSMKDSFTRLREELAIDDSMFKENKLKNTIILIYKYFETRDSLFVFDNAEEDGDLLNKFLPTGSSPYIKKPFVLLTSRYNEWSDKFQKLKLDVFSKQESLDFLRRYLELQTEKEIELAGKLSEILQKLPIAVRQAAAFIKKEREITKLSTENCVQKYLGEFSRNAKSVLGYQFWKKTGDTFQQTTLLTWNVTLQKIKNNQLSVRIMRIMSVLGSENLPMSVFEHLEIQTLTYKLIQLVSPISKVNISKVSVHEAIALLAQYSLIDSSDAGYLSIHRLVQTVIREQLSGRKIRVIMKDTMELLRTFMRSVSDDRYKALCLVHFEKVLRRAEPILLYREFSKFVDFVQHVQEKSMETELDKAYGLYKQGKLIEAIEIYRNVEIRLLKSEIRQLVKLQTIRDILNDFQIHGDYEEEVKFLEVVGHTENFFSSPIWFSPIYSIFEEQMAMYLLRRRKQIADSLDLKQEEFLISRKALDTIRKNAAGSTALDILTIASHFSEGVSITWFENFYGQNMVKTCISLLRNHSLVEANPDPQFGILQLQVHPLVRYWTILYDKINKNVLVKCLEIVRAPAGIYYNDVPTLSLIWKKVLTYEELAQNNSSIGVKACLKCKAKDEDMIFETVSTFSKKFLTRATDIIELIQEQFRRIKVTPTPNNLKKGAQLSSFLRNCLFGLPEGSSIPQLRLDELFKLSMLMLDLLIEQKFEMKKTMTEEVLYFLEILNSNRNLSYGIPPEVLILIPLVLLFRVQEAMALAKKFELTPRTCNRQGLSMCYNSILCLVLGTCRYECESPLLCLVFGSCRYECEMNLDLLNHVEDMCLKSYKICRNQNLVACSHKFLALGQYCMTYRSQIHGIENDKLNNALEKEKNDPSFSKHFEDLECSFRVPISLENIFF